MYMYTYIYPYGDTYISICIHTQSPGYGIPMRTNKGLLWPFWEDWAPLGFIRLSDREAQGGGGGGGGC